MLIPNGPAGASAIPYNVPTTLSGSSGSAFVTGLAPSASKMPLDQLSESLAVSISRVGSAGKAVGILADKLFGEVPVAGATSAHASPPAAGALMSLNMQADYLQACLTELEAQINRLTPLA